MPPEDSPDQKTDQEVGHMVRFLAKKFGAWALVVLTAGGWGGRELSGAIGRQEPRASSASIEDIDK